MATFSPTVAPTVTLELPEATCCQSVICCSSGSQVQVDAKRIVLKGEGGLGTESEPGCCDCITRCFKRIFCCCCKPSVPSLPAIDERERALALYEMFLRQQYGEAAAKAAPVLARVDLEAKRTSHGDLCVREVRDLNRTAEEISRHLSQMVDLFKRMKFAAQASTVPRDAEEEMGAAGPLEAGPLEVGTSGESEAKAAPLTPSHVVVDAVDAAALRRIRVLASDDREQPFEDTKLKTRILQIVTSAAAGSIDTVVERIKGRVLTSGEEVVSSDQIRQFAIEELRREALEISRPAIMARFRDVSSLLRSRQIKDLSADEIALLYTGVLPT